MDDRQGRSQPQKRGRFKVGRRIILKSRVEKMYRYRRLAVHRRAKKEESPRNEAE